MVALVTVAHAVLDAEVDSETDKQHEKRDRDHVERADHQEAEGCRDGETACQREEDRQDDSPGLERKPEDEQHDENRADAVEDHALLDGGEFLVGDRDRAGQANARLVVGAELGVDRGLAHGIGRLLAGFERAVIELREDIDELCADRPVSTFRWSATPARRSSQVGRQGCPRRSARTDRRPARANRGAVCRPERRSSRPGSPATIRANSDCGTASKRTGRPAGAGRGFGRAVRSAGTATRFSRRIRRRRDGAPPETGPAYP